MVIEDTLVESLIFATWSLRSCHQHKFETVGKARVGNYLQDACWYFQSTEHLKSFVWFTVLNAFSQCIGIIDRLKLCLSAKSPCYEYSLCCRLLWSQAIYSFFVSMDRTLL